MVFVLFDNDCPVASRLLPLNCKHHHKFPQVTSTTFDNHPPSKRAISLRIVWLHYFFHTKWMNYAPNGTIIKTRHVCQSFGTLCLVGCTNAVPCASWFFCYPRIFQFVRSGRSVASATLFCTLSDCNVWALVLLVPVLSSYNCIHLEQFPVCLLGVQESSFECTGGMTGVT